MSKTLNTYVAITIYRCKPGYFGKSSGRIYVSCESSKLDLHLRLSYDEAKREMAKLMLRCYQMPTVVGKDDPDMTMYTLHAFLD